jgi:hypothetical protein
LALTCLYAVGQDTRPCRQRRADGPHTGRTPGDPGLAVFMPARRRHGPDGTYHADGGGLASRGNGRPARRPCGRCFRLDRFGVASAPWPGRAAELPPVPVGLDELGAVPERGPYLRERGDVVVREKPEEALLDLSGQQRLVVAGEHDRGLLLHVRLREGGEQDLAQAPLSRAAQARPTVPSRSPAPPRPASRTCRSPGAAADSFVRGRPPPPRCRRCPTARCLSCVRGTRPVRLRRETGA